MPISHFFVRDEIWTILLKIYIEQEFVGFNISIVEAMLIVELTLID